MLNVILLVCSYSKLERVFDYRFQFEPTSSFITLLPQPECTAIIDRYYVELRLLL